MKAFFQNRWSGFVVVLVTVATLTGLAALAGEARVLFFIQARFEIYPLAFLFPIWSILLMAGSLKGSKSKRLRAVYAGGAMLMFSGLFTQMETVTLWGMVQALACAGFISWLGFGRLPRPEPGEEDDRP